MTNESTETAVTETEASASAGADVLPETAWQRMSTHERGTFLAPHTGQRIRYMLLSEARRGRMTYGPAYPMPWHEGIFNTFASAPGPMFRLFGQPGISVSRTDREPGFSHFGAAVGALLAGVPSIYAFADLYDVQPVTAPTATQEPADTNKSADVYAANDVACPHCGTRLRITFRHAIIEEVGAES